jgi:hypothetical protein
MPYYFTIAQKTGSSNRFLCVSDTPITGNNLPSTATCVKLQSQGTDEGYCPPSGTDLPKKNYITYDASNNSITLYKANAGQNCSVNYSPVTIQLGKQSNYLYFRAMILYSFSMKNYSVAPWDTSTAPSSDRAKLSPFSIEAWYFQFDSLEDAINWNNPKNYYLTPLAPNAVTSIYSNGSETLARGVGWAREPWYINVSSYKNTGYTPYVKDFQDGGSTAFHSIDANNVTMINTPGSLDGIYTYEGDLYNNLYNASVTNRYFYIPLWPLINKDASVPSDLRNAIDNFNKLYIASIEQVYPDRGVSLGAPSLGGGGYWVYFYNPLPSLAKLTNVGNFSSGGVSDYEINYQFNTAYLSPGGDGALYKIDTDCNIIVGSDKKSRLLYPTNGFAVPYSTSKYTETSSNRIELHLRPLLRFDIGGGTVRDVSLYTGISVVYAIQYGTSNNDVIQVPPIYNACPPNNFMFNVFRNV